MKFTKKQWIIGASIAIVLAGGGTALAVNHQAQVRAEKIVQEEKAAYDKLIKVAQEATKKAETFKAEADVKEAQDAIKKLKEKDQTALTERVEKVRQNWDLVNKAEKNVVSAEKVKTEATVKTAQTAINQLKADMTKAKKTALQQRLDKVKAAIKARKEEADKKAKAEAEKQAQTAQTAVQNNAAQDSSDNAAASQAGAAVSNGDTSYNGYAQAQAAPSYTAPAQNNSGYVASTPSGGSAQAPAQPQPSTGNPAYNSGAGANANSHKPMEEIDKWTEDANAHPGGFESANGGR